MKQRTCMLAIVAALVLMPEAPTLAGTRIEVGPKMGLTFVTMTGEQASDLSLTQGSDPGFLLRGHVGAFASIELYDYLAIQTEIAFVQRGAEWEKSISSNDITSTATQSVEVDYIEIPIFLKFTIPTSGRFQPYLAAGPAVAFNAGSESKFVLETFKGDSKISYLDYYADNIQNAKGTIFKAVVSGGVGMKIGNYKLSLEGRYTRSFGDTFEDVADLEAVPEGEAVIANIPSGKALDVQHSAFTVLIGLSIGLDL